MIILARSFLIIFFFMQTVFTSLPAGCAEKDSLTIGALFSLTGERSTIGEECKAALEAALLDINAYLTSIGSPLNIKADIQDTKTDPAYNPQILQDFKKKGIKIVIGPQTSSEAEIAKEYADSNGLILLSPSATSPSLGIIDDNLFRFCPDDSNQAATMAKLFEKNNVTTVIEVHRNDLWGKDLIKYTGLAFQALGGKMIAGAFYNSNTRDFSRLVKLLETKLSDTLEKRKDPNTVAMFYAGFDELVNILYQVKDRPVFSKVKWYGTESTTRSEKLAVNKDIADFAAKVRFTCLSYAINTDPSELDRYNSVLEKISQKVGRKVNTYALNVYDIAWLAVKSYLVKGANDIKTFKRELISISQDYQGITGPLKLNERGDRVVYSYDIWSIKNENGTVKWAESGKCVFNQDGSVFIEQDK